DCTSDRDCENGGLSCECGVCTRACDVRDCSDLSKDATCVMPSSAAERACRIEKLSALCTVACAGDADCRPFGNSLQCVGGACLSRPRAARDAGVDSSMPPPPPPPPSPDATIPPPPGQDGSSLDHSSPPPDTGRPPCSIPDAGMVLASPVVPAGVTLTNDAAL